jgi:hypothetical protein
MRNYATDIEYQREVWRRKPALRAIYAHWYARCIGALAKHRPTVEVDCASGSRTTLAELGPCKLVEARKFGFLLYPLSGGFSAHSFLICRGLSALMKTEDWVTRPFSRRLTGMRMLVVSEKTPV